MKKNERSSLFFLQLIPRQYTSFRAFRNKTKNLYGKILHGLFAWEGPVMA